MITQLAQRHPDPTSDRAPRGARAPVRTLETDRLCLSALRSTDLEALMSVYGKACASYEAAQARLREMMLAGSVHWAIRLPDERLVGVISLTTQKGLHSFGPTLGVIVDPAFQRRGYAQEAIDGLLSQLRREDRHRVIHAAHQADNDPASRMLINAGFLYTGRRTTEADVQSLHMVKIL